jgi:methanogenic corrinoid protein MtbC1
MINMAGIAKEIRKASSDTKILVGGAPVNAEFSRQIGADFYAPDPRCAVDYLNQL